jgi:hypothetical protein
LAPQDYLDLLDYQALLALLVPQALLARRAPLVPPSSQAVAILIIYFGTIK